MALSDKFDNMRDGFESPCENAEAVVNDTPFSKTCRALYVGGDGDVAVEMAGGEMTDATVVFSGALAGSTIPIRCTQVNATGTTATNIVALW